MSLFEIRKVEKTGENGVDADTPQIEVITPYHRKYTRDARKIGGRWKNRAWVFPELKRGRVINLIRKHYGIDLSLPYEEALCEISAEAVASNPCEDLKIGAVSIARAFENKRGGKTFVKILIKPEIELIEGDVSSIRKGGDVCIVAHKATFRLMLPKTIAEQGSREWNIKVIKPPCHKTANETDSPSAPDTRAHTEQESILSSSDLKEALRQVARAGLLFTGMHSKDPTGTVWLPGQFDVNLNQGDILMKVYVDEPTEKQYLVEDLVDSGFVAREGVRNACMRAGCTEKTIKAAEFWVTALEISQNCQDAAIHTLTALVDHNDLEYAMESAREGYNAEKKLYDDCPVFAPIVKAIEKEIVANADPAQTQENSGEPPAP